MVLDDVQFIFDEFFLSSQASRASGTFTFFNVSLKNFWIGLPEEKLSDFGKVSILLMK